MKTHDIIDSVEKFQQIIQSIRERRAFTQGHQLPYRHEFYRGQLDSTWPIIPSLSRGVNTAQHLADVETAVMSRFKELVMNNKQQEKIFLHEQPSAFQNEWLWLSQAQHLGIPTRLLDWTIHPEVALYFVLDNNQFDNVDGQFLVSYVPPEYLKIDGPENRQFSESHYQDLVGTTFINPAFFWNERYNEIAGEVRRARQHGKFSIQEYSLSIIGMNDQHALLNPWDESYETIVIEKYIIPADKKSELRKEITARGWSGEFLYGKEDIELNEIVKLVKEEHQKLIAQIKTAAQ